MNKKWLYGIKLLVSISLITFLLTLIDLSAMLERFSDINRGYLVLALLLLVGQIALSAFKWKIILRADGTDLGYLFLVRTYIIGNFLSLFLPSSFGGDVYRVIAIKGANQSLLKSTSSVLFDRLTGLFALLSISAVAYIFLPNSPYKAWVALLYLAGVGTLFLVTSGPVFKRISGIQNRIVTQLLKLLASFRAYRQNLIQLSAMIAISLAFQFNIVVINKIYCAALNIDMSFAYLLVIVPLIYLTEVLPISINSIGVRDSAFVFFFTMMGHAAEEGFAVALLILLMRYIVGLVGGAVLLIHVIHQNIQQTS